MKNTIPIKYYSKTKNALGFNRPNDSGFDLRAISPKHDCFIVDVEYLDSDFNYCVEDIIQNMLQENKSPMGERNDFVSSIRDARDNHLYLGKSIDKRFLQKCFDENVKEIFIIPPFTTVHFETGIHIELPENIDATIRPRSGINMNTNLIGKIGTIDWDYRGDWGIGLQNTSSLTYFIIPNDRIAQGVINIPSILTIDAFYGADSCTIIYGAGEFKAEKPYIKFIKVDSLDEFKPTDRGDAGFGSSGTK